MKDAFLLPIGRETFAGEPREAAPGREPVSPVRVLERRHHDVVGKSVLAGVGSERAAVPGHARDAAAEGPDPQVSVAILEDREDGVGPEPVPAPVVRPLAVLESIDARAHGSGPDASAAVDVHRRDPVAREPVGVGVALLPRALEPHEAAAARPDPERAVRVLGDRHDRGAQIRHRLEPVTAGREPVEDPLGGPCPDDAAAVLEDRPGLRVREALRLRVDRNAALLDPVEPAVGGPDPEASLAVFEKREDPVRREPLLLAVAREVSVPEAEEAALGSDPEAAVAIPGESAHEAVREPALRTLPEHLRLIPLDAHEALAGARPEPTRVRKHREDGARESVADRPDLEAALLEARGAPAAPDPDDAVGVLRQGVNLSRGGKTFGGRERADLAAGHVREPEARADPDRAVARFEE